MSKTAKELAEATATMALDSLRAALSEEVKLRDELKEARGHSAGAALIAERKWREAETRTNAAFKAWREACEAVPS